MCGGGGGDIAFYTHRFGIHHNTQTHTHTLTVFVNALLKSFGKNIKKKIEIPSIDIFNHLSNKKKTIHSFTDDWILRTRGADILLFFFLVCVCVVVWVANFNLLLWCLCREDEKQLVQSSFSRAVSSHIT